MVFLRQILGLRPFIPRLVQFCETVRMLFLYLGLENRRAYPSPIGVSDVESTCFTNYDCIIDQSVVFAEFGDTFLMTKRANF